MRIHIVLHKTSELDDWEEKVRSALEGKVEPLELDFTWVPRCTDVLFVIDNRYDLTVAILAPKKEYMGALGGVVALLLEKGVRVFLGTYDEMPSLLEDFIVYLLGLLGVKD